MLPACPCFIYIVPQHIVRMSSIGFGLVTELELNKVEKKVKIVIKILK